ncbi:MAG TPA: ATP-binding protein, partial [Candidatus Obscuribacterales bacterium]
IEPGIVLFKLCGQMDLDLARAFTGMLDQLYEQLEAKARQTFLLLDATEFERLNFQAQRLLFSRGMGIRPRVLGIHCATTSPLFRSMLGLIKRMQPTNRQLLQTHDDAVQALEAIRHKQHLQQGVRPDKGPELIEEAFTSEHATLRYFQPAPDILLCESEGITNATAAHHMIAVHGRWLKAIRQQFGKGILIIDSRKSRHSTIEAYRVMRGELGEAGPKPDDIICVITNHWPQAVNTLVSQLLRNLDFRLIVVGTLEEALAAVARPDSATPARRKRRKGGLRQQVEELKAENAQLRQERHAFLRESGILTADILLHKQAAEMHQISELDLQGPYQEIYESLYMLQHDYQEYLGTLQQEIDERIQAEHRAAELSQVKSRFLGNVSHELRTPLNAIIGFTSLMLKGKGGSLNPQQRLYLERVHDNSMHLLALINDVLDISKIESGTIRLHPEALPIADFLERVFEPLRLMAARKDLPLLLEIDSTAPPILHIDPDRLRQIVTNLVNNALKFTQQGQVSVRYRSWPNAPFVAALEVRDTGIGIPKEDQKKIFEAFIQAHNGHYPGAGLGLSICMSLTFMLGYQLELESAPGQGSLFRVLMKDLEVTP